MDDSSQLILSVILFSSTENLVEIGHFSDVNESSEQRRDGDVCYAIGSFNKYVDLS